MNTLYSPFTRFSDIAREFMRSKDDPELLHNFANSWLAEPWEDTKLKTNAEMVMERQTETPEWTLPPWTKLVTGGIDVQENCLYWTIRAWGDYMTSQNISHGQALSMGEVERIMNTELTMPNGEKVMVNLALMDSGDQTEDVYEFCALNSDWALPCKGTTTMLSHYRLSTVNKAGSRANGMTLVLVDGGKYKDQIAARMRKENGTGAWMVYQGCDLDYAEQVTAEHKITERSGGKEVQRWVLKTSHADNHYLDCEVYAAAAADVLGVRNLYLQNRVEENAQEVKSGRIRNRTPAPRRKTGSKITITGFNGGHEHEQHQQPGGNAGTDQRRDHGGAFRRPVLQDRQPEPDPCGPFHTPGHAGRTGGADHRRPSLPPAGSHLCGVL